ncbi:MAG TPA: 6-phosphogluconolactonase [Chthoniobacteraceae bacterium]|jgi:6-phosphogluconolactonase|nr:6-phosphogluconolactonase [Chthoniobacteraceae bacterium]
MKPRLISLPLAEFATRSAALIEEEIRAAIAARGACRLALAGGETPRAIYAALPVDLPWEKVWITFGDERCVPPDDKDSNYKMARESLLDRVPTAHVLRIRGEIPQEPAAAEYEQLLAVEAARTGEARFVHDLILLGMGEDGHTASLFPGMETLKETVRSVLPAHGPKPPPQRVTMTLPLLNAARKVFFLAKGAGKAEMLRRVLSGDPSLPSALVHPAQGEVAWLLSDDLAAAVQ